jgi:hypothetical protein
MLVQNRQYHLTQGKAPPHVEVRETPNPDNQARINRHVHNLTLLGPQDVYRNLVHLDSAFLEDFNIDAQCHCAELITGFFRGALRTHPQRTWLVNQEHYVNVVTHHVTHTGDEADLDDYVHTEIQTSEQSTRKRRRRFSVVVNTVDGYDKPDTTSSVPLNEQECKEITIKDPLLERPKAKEDSKAEWLRDAKCEINEQNYCEIEVVGEWFHDEVITTGFALVSRVLDCQKHRISICDPRSANGLYSNFYQPDAPFQNHEIVIKCRDKHFIILPICDGYSKIRLQGEADAEHQATIDLLQKNKASEAEITEIVGQYQNNDAVKTDTGSHWSVLIVDCHTPHLQGHYFDSWKEQGYSANLPVVREVMMGLWRFFKYDRPGYYASQDTKLTIDANVPKQHLHNRRSGEEGSACGPYVWALVKEVVQYIVECREDEERTGLPVEIELALPEYFNVNCG